MLHRRVASSAAELAEPTARRSSAGRAGAAAISPTATASIRASLVAELRRAGYEGAVTTCDLPVAFEVAEALDAPLDVIVVCKLGVPFQPELAMGAIGEGGTRVLDTDVLTRARISDDELRAVERAERVQTRASGWPDTARAWHG